LEIEDMPTYVIEGKKIRTDSALTDDEIDEIAATFKNTAKQKITPQEYDDAWAANVLGAGLGLGDELLAGARAANRFISGIGDLGSQDAKQPGSFSSDYTKELGQVRQSQEKLADYSPEGSFMGQLAGGLPFALLTGGPASSAVSRVLPKVGTVGNAAITGAGFGGVAGFGSGEGGLGNRIGSAVVGAGVGGVTGGVIEGVARPVVGNLVRYFKRAPTLLDPDTNAITPQGRKFVAEYAQRAGLNINELSDDLQRELATQAQMAGKAKALNPQQTVALAEANTLPVKGPMTQGQLTQDPDLHLFESEAAKGRYGPDARKPIEAIYSQTQNALEENAQAIRARVAGLQQGARSVSEPGTRGDIIQRGLAQMRDTELDNVNDLYRKARQGGDAAIDGSAYRQGVQKVLLDVAEDFDPDSVPKVTAILNKLSTGAQSDGSADTLLSSVFRARRNLTSLQGEIGTADGAAAGKAKRALDQYLIDNMDEAAISGDVKTISRWKDAISAFKNYATKFEGDDLVQTLTERGNLKSTLKVDPVDAVNVIFGRDAVGFVGKGGLTRDLIKMRELLGEESAAWKALKEEAFLRFLRKSDGAMRPTEQAFSGGNFAKAWNSAKDNSPHILRVLFTNEEQQLISQFARYAQRVTIAPVGGVNTSNTGGAIAKMLQKILGSNIVGPKVIAFLESTPVLRSLTEMPDAYRASMAAQPRVSTAPVPILTRPAPEATALGATTAAQQFNQ